MSLPLALYPFVALSLGLFAANLFWPRDDLRPSSLALRLSLGVGLGLALLSFLMFFWLMAEGRWSSHFNLLMWASLALGPAAFWLRRPAAATATGGATGSEEFAPIARAYFFLALAAALVVFVFYFWKNPHGNWDAWSHWNLRARFVFWGGEKWANALHPDYWNPLNYPLLWPMAVSAGWGFVGAESRWIPGLTAMLFALGTVVLLTSALARTRGKTQGYLAGILLLGTPFFLTHGVSQYSDIPLAFFFLATFAAAARHDAEPSGSPRFLILAGTMAGLAAWTKNEGLLFILCFCAARLGTTLLRGGWRHAASEGLWLTVGLLPVMAVVLYVKTQLYSSPRTIFETRGVLYNFANFTNLERYRKILTAYWHTFFGFGKWGLSLTLLMIPYALWMGRTEARAARSPAAATLLTLLFMICGYFAVYLATPHNLDWHIGTSVDRLFLCMWPGFLFGYFLSVRTPEEAVQGAEDGQRAPSLLPQTHP